MGLERANMRFINADNYELVAELSCVAGQLNMYAYCGNNPIMYTDETGEFAWIAALIILGTGALLGGINNGVKSSNDGNSGWDVVLDTIIGAGAGMAIAGGVLALGGVLSVVGSGIAGMIVAKSIIQVTALGIAGFNLGRFLSSVISGIKPPEPVEMPTEPQPPIQIPTIVRVI